MTIEEVGCVYALGNEALPGLIKIGMTANLKRRVSELSSASLPYWLFQCRFFQQCPLKSFS